MRSAICCAWTARLGVEVRAPGRSPRADAVALGRLDHRVRRGLAARRAGHERGQLAPEVDQLLGQHPDAGRRGGLERRRRTRSAASTNQTPLPSYPPRRGLEDAREAERGRPRRARRRPRCAGTGRRARPAPSRITPLSWACTSASGPGRTAMPSASSACRWSVGTCSWSKVTTAQPVGDRAQRGEVGVVADRRGRGSPGRRETPGRLGEQPQRDAQRGGRLGHHPGQLAAADDGDDGASGRASITRDSVGGARGSRSQAVRPRRPRTERRASG